MNWFYIIFLILFIPLLFFFIFIFRSIKSLFKYIFSKNSYSHLPRNPSTFKMLELFEPDGIKKYFNEIIDKDGNIKSEAEFIGPHLDGSPTVIVFDAELFRDLLIEKKFPKLDLVYDSMRVMIGNGLVTSTGELWKRERRLLTPLFHFAKLKQMPNIMNNRIKQFCIHLHKVNSKEVVPTTIFGTLALEIVIDCVFGGEHYLSASVMDGLWETTNKSILMYFLSDLMLGSTINKITPFPWNIKLYSSMNKIKKLVDNAIAMKQAEIELDNEGNFDSDLLGSLLRVRDNETGQGIPLDLIRDESLTFLFAGHDTTSSLLSWCMTFLAYHPKIVENIRKEIKQVLGDRTIPEFKDIKKFKYIEMVLKETLRMRPPVPLLDRTVGQDINLGSNTYKSGTAIYPCFIAAHYDKRFWNNPFEFNPDRFKADEESKRHAFSFTPFSAGTRNCIGRKFSMMEAILVLSQILQQFDIESSEKPEDVLWIYEGTMKPVNYKCRFIPREKK